jgi:hypothetical protein
MVSIYVLLIYDHYVVLLTTDHHQKAINFLKHPIICTNEISTTAQFEMIFVFMSLILLCVKLLYNLF